MNHENQRCKSSFGCALRGSAPEGASERRRLGSSSCRVTRVIAQSEKRTKKNQKTKWVLKAKFWKTIKHIYIYICVCCFCQMSLQSICFEGSCWSARGLSVPFASSNENGPTSRDTNREQEKESGLLGMQRGQGQSVSK